MEKDSRKWKCRNCGRSNMTSVSLDGTVKCDHCSDLTSIQPSRVPGKLPPGRPRPEALAR